MSSKNKSIHNYLCIYNGLLFVAWLFLFVYTLVLGLQLNQPAKVLLNIAQIAALLEIVHALFKWVSTPALTSAKQIFSRILVLILINILPPDAYVSLGGINGLHLILIAWCLTEIIRYAFYFLKLIQKKSKGITFLRYTLFLVLYPIGVTGEILIILSYFKFINWLPKGIVVVFVLLMLIYLIFFPGMYGHMLKQRAKKLN